MAFQISNFSRSIAISTANANLDGTGTITSLLTVGGTYGSVLNTIRINSYSAVPVGMIRIFVKSNVAMAPWTLFKEVMVPETPNNDPPYPVFALSVDMNLSLENAWQVGVSTETATNFIITGFGYDITGFI